MRTSLGWYTRGGRDWKWIMGKGGRVRYKTKGDEWIGIEGKGGFVCDNRGLQMENIKEKPQESVICSWSNIKAWCSTVSGH